MVTDRSTGVLVMAYGTASGPDDIERYYTDIRGGRTPTPEHLEELRGRYAAIGNRFPLLATTAAQADGIVERLNADGGDTFRAYLGMKHSSPTIPDAVEQMAADGVDGAVGIVMAPHWSGMSVETYMQRAEAAIRDRGIELPITFVRSFHDHPMYMDCGCRRGCVRRSRRWTMPRAPARRCCSPRTPCRCACWRTARSDARPATAMIRVATGTACRRRRISSRRRWASRITGSRGSRSAVPPTRGGGRASTR